jgi:4-hydroxybenzoyl-CoA reductase subunit beta
MIRLPAFRYLAPQTLAEAARMLAEAGPGAMPVSGGTDLYPNIKRRQVTPPAVVGLRRIREMHDVRKLSDGSLSIGAGVTLTHLAAHPLVREFCPALGDTALLIASPFLRNMGTLGGNLCLDTRCHFLNQSPFWRKAVGFCLKAEGDVCRVAPGSARCWAITSADLPPLLIALGAQVRVVGVKGERVLPLAELYRDDGIEYLNRRPDEVVAEITLPPLDGTRSVYLKLRRRGTFDFPALGVAAALRLEPDGRCAAAAIVLGAVTSRPMVVAGAQMLVGNPVTAEAIAALAGEITRQARPLHLADYTLSYRKQMVAVYVTRALTLLTAQRKSDD